MFLYGSVLALAVAQFQTTSAKIIAHSPQYKRVNDMFEIIHRQCDHLYVEKLKLESCFRFEFLNQHYHSPGQVTHLKSQHKS